MEAQEIRDLVFKQLDMILESVQNTAKAFKITLIPIRLIEKTVNIGKIDIDQLEKGSSSKNFFIEYNKMLVLLIEQCEKDDLDMETTKIPLALFESHIDLIKSSFTQGEKTTV